MRSNPGVFARALIALASALWTGCNTNKNTAAAPDPRLIASYSDGVIGRNQAVRVVFTSPQDISKPLDANAVKISPKAEGELSWENSYTLAFTPAASNKSETN
jgi:hypothetical protein